jgi:hypothetical protein
MLQSPLEKIRLANRAGRGMALADAVQARRRNGRRSSLQLRPWRGDSKKAARQRPREGDV